MELEYFQLELLKKSLLSFDWVKEKKRKEKKKGAFLLKHCGQHLT